MRRALRPLPLVVALAAASILTACTISFAGGVAGLVAAALAALGLLATGASQAGCGGRSVEPCLSIGPCLEPPYYPDAGRDAEVGPCLSIGQLPDAAVDSGLDARVGPCLEAPAPDAGRDAEVGPCLDIAPDSGTDAAFEVCLSMWIPDAGEADSAPAGAQSAMPPVRTAQDAAASARSGAIEKLRDRLPPDVVARLERGRGPGAGGQSGQA